MATKYHMIGAGGSGAKALTAFVHCAAAGLGPRVVQASLLDQDVANGNVQETNGLINLYRRLHKAMATASRQPRDRVSLFATAIEIPNSSGSTNEPRTWIPLEAKNPRMGDHFEYARLRPELKQLMKVLFKEREEILLDLERGFRGRPAIGAVVMAAMDGANPLHKYIHQIADATQDSQRVFLMGSVFGGMGASGVPTLARKLRSIRYGDTPPDRDDTALTIGAGMLLPYFEFPPPTPDETDRQVAVKADDLPWASRLALEYYDGYMGTDAKHKLFNHLYLVGQQPLTSVGYFSTGSEKQRNPALLPELLVALAGCHFFASTPSGQSRVFRTGHREKHIGWDDLPRVWSGSGSDQPHEVRAGLAQLLRFAFAYHYAYFPCLDGDEAPRYRKFDWFRKLVGGRSGFPSDEEQELARDLNQYCTQVLRWIADIRFGYPETATVGDVKLAFCNTDGFAKRPAPKATGRHTEEINRIALVGDTDVTRDKGDRVPPQIKNDDLAGLEAGFNRLVGDDLGQRVLGLDRILDALERTTTKEKPGFVTFVDALWTACAMHPRDKLPSRPPQW